MEDLNKTQIILLGLLVSFVSSVATSIMTYSLLSEAPSTITQTINRVVERTIETITPSPTNSNEIVREVTVVVKEEDLVIEAISKNEDNLVRINTGTTTDALSFSGFGLILDEEGLIVAPKIDFTEGKMFEAVLADSSKVILEKVSVGQNFSFWKIRDFNSGDLREAILGDSDSLQLGQTIISIMGRERSNVSIGRVVGLSEMPLENQTILESKFSLIESDMPVTNIGSPAINLKGEIIGLSLYGGANFLPINILKKEMESI